MKATGMTRKLDNLGRVCIPMELRQRYHMDVNDTVEFYVDGGGIVLKKFDAAGDLEQLLDNAEKWIRSEKELSQEMADRLLAKLEEMRIIAANCEG